LTACLTTTSTPGFRWHGPARNVLAALDVLEQLDVDTFIPGHGPVTDVSTVRLLKAYWKFVQRAAGACAYAGTPKLQCGYVYIHPHLLLTLTLTLTHWLSPVWKSVSVDERLQWRG
jgi:glyoxylase-like metal-dependent hydrolase (beta-lactamase superfamily II)